MLVLGFWLTGLSCGGLGGPRPGGPEATSTAQLLQRANGAYEGGDLTAARQSYARILETEPEHVEALFKLGVVDYRQGQFEQSRSHFLKVLSTAPDHRKATYNLGVIYSAEGPLKNTEKATFFFDRYLSLVPNAPQRQRIMRWKTLQASEKRRGERPVAASGSGNYGRPGTGEAASDDLKQWLQQEAERMAP
jgi:tetratricopeptide (TPR) repeat protein